MSLTPTEHRVPRLVWLAVLAAGIPIVLHRIAEIAVMVQP